MKGAFLMICCVLGWKLNAQQTEHNAAITKHTAFNEKGALSSDQKKDNINNLYNYGVIDAFVGGLYRGTLPIEKLKLKGDFGLGAPDMLDGELTLVDGKAYQTKATGQTIEVENNHLTSFASVTFFKTDTAFIQTTPLDKDRLFYAIEKLLPAKNKMYAIKISGRFDHLKTRAFPPVKNEPFPKLADILDRQHFFEYKNMSGTLVGFFLPDYLNGINASGFHFHFLSDDRKWGGHLLELNGKHLKIEIARLKTFEMETPNDKAFREFEFTKMKNESLKRVEQGK
ncbi:MAG: acetolactate decarboxylase [Bacteroidota bacterium]